MLTRPDGRILAAHPAACRMLGRTEEELCRLGRAAVADPLDPRVLEAIQTRAETGRFQSELTFLCHGEPFPVEVSTSVFLDEAGEPKTTIVFRDITERERTHESLQRVQKLESLGVLAGGIAAAQGIRSLDPDAVLIAVSGYSDLSVSFPEGVTGFNDRMAKPYLQKDLAIILGKLLGG